MKKSYLAYYEKESARANFHFLWDLIWTQSKRRKFSLTNRMKDYQEISEDALLLRLHREINEALLQAVTEYDGYDYGEGYFYQSCSLINVKGFRDTEMRINAMELPKLLKGKQVLEIGCNTGFLSLSLAQHVGKIVGMELNPHLIDIAQRAQDYLNISNTTFEACSFEAYKSDVAFDAVLSFANHSTYDGKTAYSLKDFFSRCHSLTKPNGLLLFESHPPEHEGDGLEQVCSIIESLFDIEHRTVLQYGGFLDTNRTFIIARRIDEG